jgi:mannose/fructose/N-acetylgalactosamine-specific phosphotransferase system component IIC
MVEGIILVTIFGGLAALDRTEAYQTMLSQPVVIGLMVGLLLKDVQVGIRIGILLQLIYLWVLPIGSAVFPDPAIGGTVGAFGFIALSRLFPERPSSVLFFTLIYTVVFALFAGWTLIKQRELNLKLIRKADFYAKEAQTSKIKTLFWWGLLGSFARGIILSGLGILGVFVLLKPAMGFFVFLPNRYLDGLEIPLLGFGIGTMFHFFGKRKNLAWLVVGLALGVVFVSV